jgi:hypothetical protein
VVESNITDYDPAKFLYSSESILWICNHWFAGGLATPIMEESGTVQHYTHHMDIIGINDVSSAYKFIRHPNISWWKKRYFKAVVMLYASAGPPPPDWTNTYQHIFMGDFNAVGGDQRLNDANHVGFKCIEGMLYATVGNGSDESVAALGPQSFLPDLYTTDYLTLEAVLDRPNSKADFFINGSKIATITENLPEEVGVTTSSQIVFNARAGSLALGVEGGIYVFYAKFYQEE